MPYYNNRRILAISPWRGSRRDSGVIGRPRAGAYYARALLNKRSYVRNKYRSRQSYTSSIPRTLKAKGTSYTQSTQRTLIGSDSQNVKLKYVKGFNFPIPDQALSGIGFRQFRGNSPYDPDALASSSTNPQYNAQGYATYQSLYQFFYVYGSSIKVTFFNNPSADSLAVECMVAPSNTAQDNAAIPPNVDQAMVPYSRCKYLGPKTSSRSVGTIEHFMSSAKVWGRDVSGDNLYSGTTDPSALPNQVWYWYIRCRDMAFNGTATTALNVAVRVEIVYYVKFWGRKFSMPRQNLSAVGDGDPEDDEGPALDTDI